MHLGECRAGKQLGDDFPWQPFRALQQPEHNLAVEQQPHVRLASSWPYELISDLGSVLGQV